MANTIKHVAVNLVNTDSSHFKFWTAEIQSRVVRLSWGRIGGRSVQRRKFSFQNNESALDFLHKRVDVRMRGGFRSVAAFSA